ncbi:hypothetical protein JVU11DRAFT_9031 [Chiua virens]|nr:hypothetical protein JVU11DRAFT_9031 [Chiua virens]
MNDTPILSPSSNTDSTEPSPPMPFSLDASLFHTPNKRPMNHQGETHPSPSSSSPESPRRPVSVYRKRTMDAHRLMKKMLTPSQHRVGRPLKLRFAMRSLDRTSHSSLSLDDTINGEDAFREGLRQLPQHLVRQFYIAKLASRDYILAHIASNLHEIDALEKTRTVLLEVKKHDQAMLATADQELTALKEVAETQCSDIEQDIAFRHAVYADELVALMVSNT